jgi:hypothetical protein
MKVYVGADVQSHVFLTLTLVGVSGQLRTLAAVLLGKEPLVPIGNEAGWAPELVWMTWRREDS